MRFKFACKCGACWTGNAPERAVGLLTAHWMQEHTGPGHADCTAREAGRVRAKEIAAERVRLLNRGME